MRYEIHQNMWGEWVIVDMETDDYVTWGNGEIAKFLSKKQATDYLEETGAIVMEEEVKKQYPGFTVTCDGCGSKEIVIECSLGYSDSSGPMGSLDFVCNSCGQRTEVYEN